MDEPSQHATLHLRSLTIRRYEQFEDCPPIEFSPYENLILGINGAGKTRLLRLVHAVLRFNYDALIEQPFDVAFDIGIQSEDRPDIVLRGEVRNQPSTASLESPWDLDAQQRAAAMLSRETVPGDGLHLRLRVENAEQEWLEYVVEQGRGMVRRGEEESDIGPVDKTGLLLHLASHLLFSFHGTRWMHHVSSQLFRVFPLVEGGVRESDADFTALVEQLAYKWEYKSRWSISVQDASWWPMMRHLARRILQGKHDEQPVLGFAASPVVYAQDSMLAPLLEALGANEISFRLKITREDIHRPGYLEGRGIEIRVRFRSGVEIVDSELTFGQKRLITIGVIALLSGNEHIPILVDELDNGLHPGMVEAAMGFIAGRQSFIASHNRLVVDLVNYDSPEDLQRKVHICRRTEDGSQRLVQLSDEEARDVFEKIDVGIMHPSDVLRTEGLW